MITSFAVVFDACVLVPATLRDVLLSSADAELFRPMWSGAILEEMKVALLRPPLNVPPDRVAYTQQEMCRAFPEAEVTGYQHLIDAMENDPGDRHVLAAAVRAHAQIIVTTNIRDFPQAALEKYDLVAQSPDEFLMDLLGLYKLPMLTVIREVAASKTKPPRTELEILQRLGRNAPNFASATLIMLEEEPDRCDDP